MADIENKDTTSAHDATASDDNVQLAHDSENLHQQEDGVEENPDDLVDVSEELQLAIIKVSCYMVPCYKDEDDSPIREDCNTRVLSNMESISDLVVQNLLKRATKILERVNQGEGGPAMLDRAVHLLVHASDLGPTDLDVASTVLGQLGNVLQTRFNLKGDEKDLDRTLVCYRTILELHPPGHPIHSSTLINLAAALCVRFNRSGNMVDINEAVDSLRVLLPLRPGNHPGRCTVLNNLAAALQNRYDHTGDVNDLNDAISKYEDVLALRPAPHPDRPWALNNLAGALNIRFERQSDPAILNTAISLFDEALLLLPASHADRSMMLGNLATALHSRYRHSGDEADVLRALDLHQQAVSLRPVGHPRRCTSLVAFGNTLHTRFERLGKDSDLDKAIGCWEEALSLQTPNHVERSVALNNLANGLLTRFERSGQLQDLSTAIAYYVETLQLQPLTHPDRSGTLNNLATALHTRSEITGDTSDLDDAIIRFEESLRLRPVGHADRSSTLNNLANALHDRFDQTRKPESLHRAIACLRESLDLRPEGHAARSRSLYNLARSLVTRFKLTNDAGDLDAAIKYHQDALLLRPKEHPERYSSLHNLANALETRLSATSTILDVETIVEYRREAAALCAPGHPKHCSVLAAFAMSTYRLYRHSAVTGTETSETEDSSRTTLLETVANTLEAASQSSISPSAPRLHACCNWIQIALEFDHDSAMKAFTAMLDLLDLTAARSHSIESRQAQLSSNDVLQRAKGLVVDAAAFAVSRGQLALAVEILERGRAILYTQVSRYRTPMDELRAANLELANEFSQLSTVLESSMVADGRLVMERGTRNAFEDEVSRYSRLTAQWNDLVERIRGVEGFQHFLKPTPFAELQKAAEQGPVILVNISKRRSDAIIVSSDGGPNLVRLPDATPHDVQALVRQVSSKSDQELSSALRSTWDRIVGPVVEVLKDVLKLRKKSRIWWCPTGATSKIPLHAAGPFKRGAANLPDMFISSYIPTLGTLIRARRSIQPTSSIPSLLVVAQPDTPGEITLDGVLDEVDCIKALAPNACILSHDRGTRDAVLGGIAQHQWVHFACHGHLNNQQPFRSRFALYDGPLHLLDLVEQQYPQAELAATRTHPTSSFTWLRA
ncbi:hypothetical protein FRB99_008006 [Tulasnella sp. 403]|nr:hypothetical protein FRB99_008006 [Tulasnella sp. 403]